MRKHAAGAALVLALGACATPARPGSEADAYADFLIGHLAALRDDHAAAAQSYADALTRAPQDQTLQNGAIAAALAAGEPDRARRVARLAAQDEVGGFARLVRAADQLADARWTRAAENLHAVEGPVAEELIARILLVWTSTAEGQVDDVTVELGSLVNMGPYGAMFAYQQALALDYAGRSDAALAAYAGGGQGGVWLPAALERYADLLARTDQRGRAIALLSEPQNRANPALAAALARAESGGAIAAEPLTVARGAAIGLYSLSVLFEQEADEANALAALTLALMIDDRFDSARLLFAQQQSQLGNDDLALTALGGIDAQSPYASSARTLEAWVRLDRGETDAAFALAEANAAADDLRAKRALADMYRSQERYAEAEPLYNALLQAQPNDWRLHFARGVARERLGRWGEAEADLQRALELSPNQADVLNYLGYSWVDRGERLQEGLRLIQRAVELKPDSGAIVDSLGWAYFRLGDYPRALDLLERAVELEPADPTLNDHLGDVYWRMGRRIEARFQWQRALALEADNAEALQRKLADGLPAEPPARSATR